MPRTIENNVDNKRAERIYSRDAVMRLLGCDEGRLREMQKLGKLTPTQRGYLTGYPAEQVETLLRDKSIKNHEG